MLAPLAVTAAAYVKRHRDFPTLVDFRLPLATSFLRAGVSATVERSELPRELQSDERDSIGVRAHLTEKTGWVLVLSEPVADWRGYTHLKLDIANPTDEPLALRLRVFDQLRGRSRHTGYRGSIEIGAAFTRNPVRCIDGIDLRHGPGADRHFACPLHRNCTRACESRARVLPDAHLARLRRQGCTDA